MLITVEFNVLSLIARVSKEKQFERMTMNMIPKTLKKNINISQLSTQSSELPTNTNMKMWLHLCTMPHIFSQFFESFYERRQVHANWLHLFTIEV